MGASGDRKGRAKVMSESMQEMMEREQEQTLATLMRANRAFERIFGVQEEEEEGEDE
jgi:PAS domain-containing protein